MGLWLFFSPILPTAANFQHHPRVYQAEHLNIFTSLIETGVGGWGGGGGLGGGRGEQLFTISCASGENLTLSPSRAAPVSSPR